MYILSDFVKSWLSPKMQQEYLDHYNSLNLRYSKNKDTNILEGTVGAGLLNINTHLERAYTFFSGLPKEYKNFKILEFGPGSGFFIHMGNLLGFDVSGLDVPYTPDRMFYYTIYEIFKNLDKMTYYSGLGKIPFKDNAFDCIISRSAMNRFFILCDRKKRSTLPFYPPIIDKNYYFKNIDNDKNRTNRILELYRITKEGGVWHTGERGQYDYVIKMCSKVKNNKNIKLCRL